MIPREISREILDYLREHPRSGDTLEGVSKWWLMQQRVSESVENVFQALKQLGKEGFVHERIMTDGRVVYFANTDSDSPDVVENDQGGPTLGGE
jgi:Fe2+ or Zn2+ uptake regulation protein